MSFSFVADHHRWEALAELVHASDRGHAGKHANIIIEIMKVTKGLKWDSGITFS